jgi:hypothetical protein
MRGLVGQVIGLWRIFPASVRILIVVGLVACATAMDISLIS